MNHLLDIIINGPAHYTYSHHLGRLESGAIVLLALFLELAVTYLLLVLLYGLALYRRYILGLILRFFGVGRDSRRLVCLQLSLPASVGSGGTSSLLALISKLTLPTGFWAKLAITRPTVTFEVASTKVDGVRFVLVVPESSRDSVTKAVVAALPGVKVKVTDDNLRFIDNTVSKVVELGLRHDYVLPLPEVDPPGFTAGLIGQMVKLSSTELVAYQIVTTPLTEASQPFTSKRVKKVAAGIYAGGKIRLRNQNSGLGLIASALVAPIRSFGRVFKPSSGEKDDASGAQMQEQKSIRLKLDQPLYVASIRVLVGGVTADEVSRLS